MYFKYFKLQTCLQSRYEYFLTLGTFPDLGACSHCDVIARVSPQVLQRPFSQLAVDLHFLLPFPRAFYDVTVVVEVAPAEVDGEGDQLAVHLVRFGGSPGERERMGSFGNGTDV